MWTNDAHVDQLNELLYLRVHYIETNCVHILYNPSLVCLTLIALSSPEEMEAKSCLVTYFLLWRKYDLLDEIQPWKYESS